MTDEKPIGLRLVLAVKGVQSKVLPLKDQSVRQTIISHLSFNTCKLSVQSKVNICPRSGCQHWKGVQSLWQQASVYKDDVTYVSQEAASHSKRFVLTALQLAQEVVLVEVVELFQIPKHDPPLAPEVLGHVHSLQLREVVLSNVTQSLGVLPLCGQQLLHDPLQFPLQRVENIIKFFFSF